MIDQLIDFLKEKPGYIKKNPYKLQKAFIKAYDNEVYISECKEALKTVRKQNKLQNKNINQNINQKETSIPDENAFEKHLKSIGLKREDVKSVKYWQTVNGEQRFSVIPKAVAIEEDKEDIEFRFKQYLDKYPSNNELLKELSTTKGIGVSMIADLHVGAFVRNMLKTQDYDIGVIKKRFDIIKDFINLEYNSENHLFILGDLIESFTGLNHKNSWKQLELHGVDAQICAFELIRDLIQGIKNLKGVYIVGGNHDRTTSDRGEDTSSGSAKIISYFLKREFPTLDIEYSDTVIAKTIDNINYVTTHGHLGLSKRTIESFLLNYAPKNNNFNVAVSAHLHSRKKTEGLSSRGDQIINDSSSYRGYVLPSIFTGNDYSEKEGFSSTAGFMQFSNMFNLPNVNDIPLI